jgi:hypothetical protein
MAFGSYWNQIRRSIFAIYLQIYFWLRITVRDHRPGANQKIYTVTWTVIKLEKISDLNNEKFVKWKFLEVELFCGDARVKSNWSTTTISLGYALLNFCV